MNRTWLYTLFALASFSNAVFAGDLFPLRTGNSWTYKEKTTGQTFTIGVGTPSIHNDQVYYSLRGYATQRVDVRIDQFNRLVAFDNETEQDLPLIDFTPSNGLYWNAYFQVCETMGQTLPREGYFDGAAGPFTGVLEIHYRTFGCADAGTDSEQFADNIGMVRRVITTFAGPRQYDLVRARIGGFDLDLPASSKMSLSVDAPAGASTWTATLQVGTPNEAPLTLDFPSGQEYELVLRDQSGQPVWTWSADKVFIAAMHSRTFQGRWVVTVDVPRPIPAEDKTPYTLQAWLMTAGNPVAFSATLPLVVSPDVRTE